MHRWLHVGLFASAFTAGAALTAHAKLASTGAATVEFKAVGPAGLSIVGKSDEVRVSDTADSVTIVIPLAKLDTGIELRNKHMKEKYLEVGKFPNAKLIVTKAAIGYPAVGGGEATGQLDLHGQTKPVKFKYEAKKGGSGHAVSGSVRVDMTAFGIEKPSYMGLSVKPDVDVAVTFNVVDS
ncbi:YceI family protein [Chondromyces crocatus]|uniref:Lipid/polyisoprenoid-binding YceI-like domain-containing protein n=1 Tax=Chondromyces crocatus TaxID=52 RepID=A0A0K1E5J8_CHOCO|nr:YceI family protein [Chondromyces crocatus]AKT36109.1 uncharacterized protein CMC5_002220 [Chondromyces crocatus]